MADYRLHPITWRNVIDYNWLQIKITPCLPLRGLVDDLHPMSNMAASADFTIKIVLKKRFGPVCTTFFRDDCKSEIQISMSEMPTVKSEFWSLRSEVWRYPSAYVWRPRPTSFDNYTSWFKGIRQWYGTVYLQV